MSISSKYADWFKRFIPSPFILAILLSILTFVLATLNKKGNVTELLLDWQNGLWQPSLIVFAFQMMFMLVLGHVLVLSDFFHSLISTLTNYIKTHTQAIVVICVTTILVAYFNWGLGLIFGAILSRKIGEAFSSRNQAMNYPLLGACGYVGLMVWHGGISGSSLAKVAESGHLKSLAPHLNLPEQIGYDQTVFSSMNFTVFVALIIAIPIVMAWVGSKTELKSIRLKTSQSRDNSKKLSGAERLEHISLFNKVFGVLLVILAVIIAWRYEGPFLGFINPNYINFTLLALAILLHKNFRRFLNALDDAISGASGILIQFPLYFGILALMQSGGLISACSEFFISISNQDTYPIFTFLSAGLVNVFVPSGGGQWAIQGPIILESAFSLGVPLDKSILALAYGDQWTNMLQPFWALPLLSITGLKAKEILPYTLILFLVGGLIFTLSLILF